MPVKQQNTCKLMRPISCITPYHDYYYIYKTMVLSSIKFKSDILTICIIKILGYIRNLGDMFTHTQWNYLFIYYQISAIFADIIDYWFELIIYADIARQNGSMYSQWESELGFCVGVISSNNII